MITQTLAHAQTTLAPVNEPVRTTQQAVDRAENPAENPADDPTENPAAKPAKIKLTSKQKDERIAELEVKLALSQPEQALKAIADLKSANLRLRARHSQIDHAERSATRIAARTGDSEAIALQNYLRDILWQNQDAFEVEHNDQSQQLAMQARIVLNQETTIHTVTDENRQLRARIADLEERQDAFDQAPRIRELEEQLAEREARLSAFERSGADTYWHEKYEGLLEWSKNLFGNKSIPIACKLVIWQFYMAISLLHAKPTGEECRVSVEETATRLGISKSTVRRAADKALAFDVLQRRYEPIECDNGDKLTFMHIRLNDVVDRPEQIKMDNEHGGKRQKGCSVDGEPLNAYTVRHCPTHHSISLYGQPGNPSGTDPEIMIDDFIRKYQNRVPLALGKKQDAFEPAPTSHHIHVDQAPVISEPEHNILETTGREIIHQQPQKPDALSAIEQIQSKVEQQIDSAAGHQYHAHQTQRPWRCATSWCDAQNFRWIGAVGDWWCSNCRTYQSEPLSS